jgi:aspartate carbamoyltransferase catalytic subunit
MGLLGKDLCDTSDLTDAAVLRILNGASGSANRPRKKVLDDRRVGLLFLEASTRTRVSFQEAAQALGADVVVLDPETTSLQKGETVLDTVRTLEAEGLNYLVIRTGTPFLPHLIASETGVRIINAGDGQHAHPTQALADILALLTVQAKRGRRMPKGNLRASLRGIRVLFTGDVRHSRVFRSTTDLLIRCGAVVGTATYPTLGLVSRESFPEVTRFHHLSDGLRWASVVYPLRVQRERMKTPPFASAREYSQAFGTHRLRKEQWLMHCGPFNRGVEVAASLVYSDRSLIMEQVRCGYRIRVALLTLMEVEGT